MKKRRIYFSSALIVTTCISIAATYFSPPLPDYYINDNGTCVQSPVTTCVSGIPNCYISITGQTGTKLIYNDRLANGGCANALQNPTIPIP